MDSEYWGLAPQNTVVTEAPATYLRRARGAITPTNSCHGGTGAIGAMLAKVEEYLPQEIVHSDTESRIGGLAHSVADICGG